MSSKFSNLLSQARSRSNEGTESEGTGNETTESQRIEQNTDAHSAPEAKQQRVAPVKEQKATPKSKPIGKSKSPVASTLGEREDETTPSSNRGRPRTGKSSDPNYTQITAYILKTTHKDTKAALLQEDGEFSELIEELLLSWLRKRNQNSKSSNT